MASFSRSAKVVGPSRCGRKIASPRSRPPTRSGDKPTADRRQFRQQIVLFAGGVEANFVQHCPTRGVEVDNSSLRVEDYGAFLK